MNEHNPGATRAISGQMCELQRPDVQIHQRQRSDDQMHQKQRPETRPDQNTPAPTLAYDCF